jgi:acetylornithine/N-succinyldiaminopimelate aminotransferase
MRRPTAVLRHLSLRTKGILTVAAGDNVVRVLPPLSSTKPSSPEFVEGLSAAAADYDVPEAA